MADTMPTRSAPPSIGETLLRAFSLAQRVVADEARLLQLESQERMQSLGRRSAWVGAGILCLLLAWVGLSAAAIVALEPVLPLAARIALLAIAQAALGAGLLAIGLRERKEMR